MCEGGASGPLTPLLSCSCGCCLAWRQVGGLVAVVHGKEVLSANLKRYLGLVVKEILKDFESGAEAAESVAADSPAGDLREEDSPVPTKEKSRDRSRSGRRRKKEKRKKSRERSLPEFKPPTNSVERQPGAEAAKPSGISREEGRAKEAEEEKGSDTLKGKERVKEEPESPAAEKEEKEEESRAKKASSSPTRPTSSKDKKEAHRKDKNSREPRGSRVSPPPGKWDRLDLRPRSPSHPPPSHLRGRDHRSEGTTRPSAKPRPASSSWKPNRGRTRDYRNASIQKYGFSSERKKEREDKQWLDWRKRR